MKQFSTLWAGVMVGAGLLSMPAHASFCIVDGFLVEINPPPQAVAPVNTHVRVRLTLSPQGPTPPGRIRLKGPMASSKLSAVHISLRLAGGTIVPAERSVLGLEQERIEEIVPRRPLELGQRYEIVVSGGEATRAVHTSAFMVGSSTDDTPPTWTGVSAGRVVHPPRVFAVIPGRPDAVAITSSADRDQPWIVAEAPEADDDGTPSASLQYGVWMTGVGSVIDYTKPPLTYLSWRAGRLLAGRDEAYPENSLCDLPRVPFPSDAGRFRLGLRAVDWAGNVSTPSEIVLDATRPTPPRLPAPAK
jgi:hypothetical protein